MNIEIQNKVKTLVELDTNNKEGQENKGVGMSSDILANKILTFNNWYENSLDFLNKADQKVQELIEKDDNDLALEKAIEYLDKASAVVDVYRELKDSFNDTVFKTIYGSCASDTDIKNIQLSIQARMSSTANVDKEALKKRVAEIKKKRSA